jgi:hypothetical protein
MATLSPREKRTVRFAAIAIAIYLALFYGVAGLKGLESGRADYQELLREAAAMKLEVHRYENKLLLLEKLKQKSNIDFAGYSRASLAGQASDAIQKAAISSGVKLGPIRESPGSLAARELATMQLEGIGEVASVMKFLHQLDTLGYPLIVDSLQMEPDPKKPGTMKLLLRALLLDYDLWMKETSRNA